MKRVIYSNIDEQQIDCRLLIKNKFTDDGNDYTVYKYMIGGYTLEVVETIYHNGRLNDGNTYVSFSFIKNDYFLPDIYFNSRTEKLEMSDPFELISNYVYFDGPYDYYDETGCGSSSQLQDKDNSESYEDGMKEAEQVIYTVENEIIDKYRHRDDLLFNIR